MEISATNQLPVLQATDGAAATASLDASRTGLALLSNSRQMDLSLVTAEGDKVTLSLDSSAVALSVMNQQVQYEGQSGLSYDESELTLGLYRRDLTFKVEGDLSREEMRDIRKVLKSLDRMMNEFVNGRMGAMAVQAGRSGDLDTIAGLEVNMSYQRQVLVAEQNQIATTYTANGLPSTIQPASETISDGSQDATIDDLAGDMAQEIRSVAMPVARLMQFVNQLMKDYRQKATRVHPKGPHMIDKVHHRLDHMLRHKPRSGKIKH